MRRRGGPEKGPGPALDIVPTRLNRLLGECSRQHAAESAGEVKLGLERTPYPKNPQRALNLPSLHAGVLTQPTTTSGPLNDVKGGSGSHL